MGRWHLDANHCRNNCARGALEIASAYFRWRLLNDERQAREEQYGEDDPSERHLVDAAEHQDTQHRPGDKRRQADRESIKTFDDRLFRESISESAKICMAAMNG